jgi:hypothetical protein
LIELLFIKFYQKDKDGNTVVPTASLEYTDFDDIAMGSFVQRVIDALGEGSRAVQMEILKQDVNDLPKLVDKMIDDSNQDFIVSSFDIAKNLQMLNERNLFQAE